jgi:hypothetical protein
MNLNLFRRTALLLLALATLATSVARARTSPPETDSSKPIYLKIAVEKAAKTEIVFKIVNNTPKPVSKGTKLYWSISGVKGSFVLRAGLDPGKFVSRNEKPTPPGSFFVFNPQPEPPFPDATSWYYEE